MKWLLIVWFGFHNPESVHIETQNFTFQTKEFCVTAGENIKKKEKTGRTQLYIDYACVELDR